MAGQCKHMLHLVPQWQSSIRHERLKVVMADRPDLIQSELAGLAFDALQQCFRTVDIEYLMNSTPMPFEWRQTIHMVIDPAAGGPQSDFAIVSFTKHRGIITVCISCYERTYSTLIECSKSCKLIDSLTKNFGINSLRKTRIKRVAL